MIHEIFPERFDNSFNGIIEIASEDHAMVFNKNGLLVKKTEENYTIPTYADLKRINYSGKKYVGNHNGKRYFLIEVDSIDENIGYEFISMYELRKVFQKPHKWIIALSYHYHQWYSENRYCGKCGNKMSEKDSERAMVCNNCNHTVYPKISPAIIVAITRGDEILLAEGVNFPSSFYSLVAGYVEPGETFEDAVKREVKEEVGIGVKNIRYYKSQPWPFSASMMIGFWADYDGFDEIVIDPNEIKEAKWFKRDSLPSFPAEDSIAGEMINLWINKKN